MINSRFEKTEDSQTLSSWHIVTASRRRAATAHQFYFDESLLCRSGLVSPRGGVGGFPSKDRERNLSEQWVRRHSVMQTLKSSKRGTIATQTQACPESSQRYHCDRNTCPSGFFFCISLLLALLAFFQPLNLVHSTSQVLTQSNIAFHQLPGDAVQNFVADDPETRRAVAKNMLRGSLKTSCRDSRKHAGRTPEFGIPQTRSDHFPKPLRVSSRHAAGTLQISCRYLEKRCREP